MTAICYPDRAAVSPDGRLTLEARSPHNGTIRRRDGTACTDADFGFHYRQHQSEFRYQLRDGSGRVLWERWQDDSEDSPHELVVADEGWSVIRTHGFAPEVIAIDPAGKVGPRVGIRGSWAAEAPAGVATWQAEHMAHSTAGNYWAGDSWPCFVPCADSLLFSWRSYWGDRLVIDLPRGTLLSGADLAAREAALSAAEKRGAYALLAELTPQLAAVLRWLDSREEQEAPAPLLPRLRRLRAALLLAGVHRLWQCVPFLRAWEEVDRPSMLRGSNALEEGWLQVQYFRPVAQHALRLLDEEPLGLPAYHFTLSDMVQRRAVPERVRQRADRLRELRPEFGPEQVLALVGYPDHIQWRTVADDWHEDWEYDTRTAAGWQTLRLRWSGRDQPGRITQIVERPSYWLRSNERELALLE